MMLMRTDRLDVREMPAAMMIESSRPALSKFMRFQASGDKEDVFSLFTPINQWRKRLHRLGP
jgi:hypothetical protein